MSTTTITNATKPATRPATFTKKAWDTQTYDAYIDYVHMIEHQTKAEDYLKKWASLFNLCGMTADVDHLLSLSIAVAKDTTINGSKEVKGEAVRKVNVIGSFRAFFNGGWMERDSRRVVYTMPKVNPHDKKAKSSGSGNGSKKGPTKAELEAQNAELTRKLAEIQALMGISAAA